ncbi:hypothetical protein EJF36_19910 [Bacillus sp. HMF5848]|nr:hypothetical protein EJF36_19910 [Bacillus sp. HMF5848]
MRNLWKVTGLVVASIMIATGCSSATKENAASNDFPPLEYNTETKTWSPMMVEYGSDISLEAYLFAIEHPEVLDYMPCYCGCEEVGHENTTDCFVDSVEGAVATLDSMGLG